ncbi:MAG: response regulator [Luteolibacter sp.]
MNPKAKILIVDDEAPMRFVIEHLLNAEGYEVSTAPNGEAAIELASRESFNLILIDLIMPRKDGIETILLLRATQPQIPIIAMSGGWNGGSQSYLRLAQKIGASLTLAKPFDRATLMNAIESELDKPHPLSA